MLSSSENVRTGNNMLLKAVRTFEMQFSSGQIEGVVFNDLNDLYSGGPNDSSGSSIDEQELMVGIDVRQEAQTGGAAAIGNGDENVEKAVRYNKLRDPAYPASHPVNAQEFDPKKKRVATPTIEEMVLGKRTRRN